MKTITKFFGIMLIISIIASCSATYNTAAYQDDVYYNPYKSDRVVENQNRPEKHENNFSQCGQYFIE